LFGDAARFSLDAKTGKVGQASFRYGRNFRTALDDATGMSAGSIPIDQKSASAVGADDRGRKIAIS